MKPIKRRNLAFDIDFLIAAMTQTPVTVLQENNASVFCEVDRGIVEKYDPDFIRIRSADGDRTHYSRDISSFLTE